MILSDSTEGNDPRALAPNGPDALASLVQQRSTDHPARVPLPPVNQVSDALRMIVKRPGRDVVVVRLSGEVDMVSVPRLAELVRQRLTAAGLRQVVLDLSEVSFLNCEGLELLLHTQRKAENREILLDIVTGSRCVDRLLEITGVDQRLRRHASIADALAV